VLRIRKDAYAHRVRYPLDGARQPQCAMPSAVQLLRELFGDCRRLPGQCQSSALAQDDIDIDIASGGVRIRADLMCRCDQLLRRALGHARQAHLKSHRNAKTVGYGSEGNTGVDRRIRRD
jgi:hypothetical protein